MTSRVAQFALEPPTEGRGTVRRTDVRASRRLGRVGVRKRTSRKTRKGNGFATYSMTGAWTSFTIS